MPGRFSKPLVIPLWLHGSDRFVEYLQTVLRPVYGHSCTSPAPVPTLPVCELDCTDATCMYLVMCAWRLPWTLVPTKFMDLWFALDRSYRNTLLTEHLYLLELDPRLQKIPASKMSTLTKNTIACILTEMLEDYAIPFSFTITSPVGVKFYLYVI